MIEAVIVPSFFASKKVTFTRLLSPWQRYDPSVLIDGGSSIGVLATVVVLSVVAVFVTVVVSVLA